jgi:hypothetical protein
MSHSKFNKTSFRPGRKKTGGRKAGVRNKATIERDEATRDMLKMITEAASRIGSDGAGKEGMVGYLKIIALYHPPTMAKLLGRVMEQEFEDERAKEAGHSL